MAKSPIQRAAKIKSVEASGQKTPGLKSAFPEKKKPAPVQEKKAPEPKPKPKKKKASTKQLKKSIKKRKIVPHNRPKKPEGMKMKQNPGKDFAKNSAGSQIDTAQRDLRKEMKSISKEVNALKKAIKSPSRKKAAKKLNTRVNNALTKIEKTKVSGKSLPKGQPLKSNRKEFFQKIMIKGKPVLVERGGGIRKGFGGGKKNPRDTTKAFELSKTVGKMAPAFRALGRKIAPLLKLVPILAVGEAVRGAAGAISDERSGRASRAREKAREKMAERSKK